jgi:hypothetical protein
VQSRFFIDLCGAGKKSEFFSQTDVTYKQKKSSQKCKSREQKLTTKAYLFSPPISDNTKKNKKAVFSNAQL